MMLKIGTCCIGMSFGIAIFVPRHDGGLIPVIFLLVIGMILVLVSPRLRTDDGDTSLPGPEGTIRRSESVVLDPAFRGRHSKEAAVVEDPNESTS